MIIGDTKFYKLVGIVLNHSCYFQHLFVIAEDRNKKNWPNLYGWYLLGSSKVGESGAVCLANTVDSIG